MKYLLTFVVYVKRIPDPVQFLFDTFGLHSNILDYTGKALLKGIKFYLQAL
jgi:hypothetical protein